uniref:Uncharacterized protein n=1 Tax=Arundo donax TaxID=35708 RepID=A0A0A9AQR3_ARUDO
MTIDFRVCNLQFFFLHDIPHRNSVIRANSLLAILRITSYLMGLVLLFFLVNY